ncbi:MAG: hypothetical protein JWO63_1767 [Frankiales bacterium]|nr:hypothetical protein [Frankiales bacterium]
MDDIEAIKILKARYFRTVDLKDWPALRALFCDDATVDMSQAGGAILGPDDFLESVMSTLANVLTVHHGHMPEIMLSGSTASGIWSMEDLVRYPDGRELHGYGHYHDAYEKHGSDWKIKSSRLTRLRVDITDAAESPTTA